MNLMLHVGSLHSSIIVYYSDIRTYIHKDYNTMFNLYVQPNRAYKSLRCLVNS